MTVRYQTTTIDPPSTTSTVPGTSTTSTVQPYGLSISQMDGQAPIGASADLLLLAILALLSLMVGLQLTRGRRVG